MRSQLRYNGDVIEAMPHKSRLYQERFSYMISGLLNEKEVSQFLKMSLPTLRRWRAAKTGPKYLKIGNAVRYDMADVTTWLESQKRVAA
jgi:predicted DNA-binding transcriptional regulator AlpA